MNLTPYVIAWGVLAIVVAALAVMRKNVAAKEDDCIHLGGAAAAVINEQVTVSKKLETIEKWGKILTVLLVVTGLALGVFYGLEVWQQTSNAGFR